MTALVLVAALVGATASVQPTAVPAVDALLAGGFAAAISYCASRAHRWTWFVLSGTAAALGVTPWVWAGLGALVISLGAGLMSRRDKRMGAMIGALAAQSLLRLPDWEPLGTSAVVVAAAAVPVVVSGLRSSPRRVRRSAAAAGVAIAGMATVFGGLAAAVAVGQRSDVEAGISAAENGLSAAQSGDDAAAIELLDEASRRFGSAHEAFGATWLGPAKAVPIVGQHLEALEVVSDEGAALARLASDAVAEADLDALRFDEGVIDVGALRDIEPPLARSAAGLTAADRAVGEIRSDWLVGPVRSRVDRFAEQVTDAVADADVALETVRIAPGLFGGEGDRRYLVLFTTPSEMRGLGGFIGNYAELTAIDGDVELSRSGRLTDDLAPDVDGPEYELSGPQDYLDRYGRFDPARFVQDTTFSPDFPTVGTVWEELYPQTPVGGPLDGVIMVDPVGLAGLLEFTGPILVEGLDFPLTADNAADFLLREQYIAFQEDENDRIDFLDEASRKTFEALTTGDIPGPQQVIDVLGPLVRGGHLAVHSVHSAEQAVYDRTGIAGALPPVADDFVALTGQNAGNSKIDIFSSRAITYEAIVDPGRGWIEATATIELVNDAPARGLPDSVLNNRVAGRAPGTNTTRLSWYTPLSVSSMTVNEFPAGFETSRELGRNVYSRPIDIPPGESRTVVIEMSGPYDGGDLYRLAVAHQPAVIDDRLVVSVSAADGWQIGAADGADVQNRTARLDQTLTEDLTIEIEFEPSG